VKVWFLDTIIYFSKQHLRPDYGYLHTFDVRHHHLWCRQKRIWGRIAIAVTTNHATSCFEPAPPSSLNSPGLSLSLHWSSSIFETACSISIHSATVAVNARRHSPSFTMSGTTNSSSGPLSSALSPSSPQSTFPA